MIYGPDAFNALVEETERQGGALLADPCLPNAIEYRDTAGKVQKNISGHTCGCTNTSRFVMTYEPESEEAPAGSGYVTMCAVCDHMAAMPRFCEAVYEVDPTMNPCYEENKGDA